MLCVASFAHLRKLRHGTARRFRPTRVLLGGCVLGSGGIWWQARNTSIADDDNEVLERRRKSLHRSQQQVGFVVLCRRTMWLLVTFLPVFLLVPLAFWSAGFRNRFFWTAVRTAIIRSRSSALTKWGQWAAVRRDFFPTGLCKELAELQSSAPTHSLEDTQNAVSCIAGISNIDMEPLGSGSIAQVHRAEYNGRHAAIKVRHPGTVERMSVDFALMEWAATLVDKLPGLGWINAKGALSQFQCVLAEQTNLCIEAENIEVLQANFSRKRRWVRFPEVLYSSEDVLIETYEKGEMMCSFAREWDSDRPKTATEQQATFVIPRGEDIYFQMLMADNFMHSDMHPGNILFKADPPQIVLLDCGMVSVLTKKEREAFVGLMQAMGDGDGLCAANRILSFSEKQDCPDPDAFRTDMKNLFSRECQGYGRGVQISEVVCGVLSSIYSHRVSMDGVYAAVLANTVCLEGLVKDLNPKFNILDSGCPYFRLHQLIGDAAFRSVFSTTLRLAPSWLWDSFFRMTVHAGLHGNGSRWFW